MKSIMIVEDNEHILHANAEYLRLYDYKVFEASTLDEAKIKLSQHTPDLIILDNQLPVETTHPQPIIAPNATTNISVMPNTFLKPFLSFFSLSAIIIYSFCAYICTT